MLAAASFAGRVAAAPAAIELTPAFGPPGTSITVKGTGFGGCERVSLAFDAQPVGTATTDFQGRFTSLIRAPTTATPGVHTVSARGQISRRSAQAPFTVTGGSGGGNVDWPQFRFDQSHTRYQPLENTLNVSNVPRLQLAWQAQDRQARRLLVARRRRRRLHRLGSTDGRLWAYRATGCGQQLCTVPLWRSTSLGQILDSPAVSGGFGLSTPRATRTHTAA